MIETLPQTTAVSMLSDILIFGLVVAVLFLTLTFGHMLCHYIPRRSWNRDNEVRSQPPSASAQRSASWFWPGSDQRSRDNGDVETGDSHNFNTSEDQAGPLTDFHGAWPGATPSQFASIDEASPGFDTLYTFGKSGEGEVSVVKQNSTGKLLVIKTVRMKKRQTATGYKTPAEAEMLTLHLSGKHPNIIVCHEFEIEERPQSPWLCHMLLEYCSGGDLADFCAHWHMLRDLQGQATRDQQCMTSASDIYTFGATLHDLVFLDGFDNKRQSYTPDDLATAFANGPYTQSPWLLEILNRTLAEDPKARMTTSELVRVAAGIKDAMVSLVEAGVRMPPNSWPPTLFADKSSAAASAESPEYISSRGNASGRSRIPGSPESFPLCRCPNHKPFSLRRPGPDCVKSESGRQRSMSENEIGGEA
ncbi:hypothetical protein B0A55_05417 [Friedmanniomyces simplex]|uniref:Protein kinase domain-containing protein n=1 Tax=Friedmanniomyces simplex TaxID=329884 RepID=A0A4U0XC32_9PEZI|nr:hypothetical protein B0A55_05417 [Friedmanniomyces simplex]